VWIQSSCPEAFGRVGNDSEVVDLTDSRT